MSYTAKEKREAAERELKMRQRVYPRWVTDKRMAQAKADYEMAVMAEIVEDYKKLETGDRLI